MELTGKNILITGGTGFIGSFLVKRLIEEGAHVRILTRNKKRLSLFGSLPVEALEANLLDSTSLRISPSTIVVHCAYGREGTLEQQKQVTIEGTKNLVEACKRQGIEKMLYLSTVLVYDPKEKGVLNENSNRADSEDFYASAKYGAETFLIEQAIQYRFPVVLLQPPIVYGPGGGAWTSGIFRILSEERTLLEGNGEKPCYALYVEDLIEAMIAAIKKASPPGTCFLLSGKENLTWRKYLEAFRRVAGSGLISETEPITFWNQLCRIRGLRKFRIPTWRLPKAAVRLFENCTEIDTTLAQDQLGFSPKVSFSEGMERVKQWFQKAYPQRS